MAWGRRPKRPGNQHYVNSSGRPGSDPVEGLRSAPFDPRLVRATTTQPGSRQLTASRPKRLARGPAPRRAPAPAEARLVLHHPGGAWSQPREMHSR